MNVKGTQTFEVGIERLWTLLMDPDVLAEITPGVTRLERLDEDQFKSVSDIKIGPVKGAFSGKLKVVEKHPPNSFAIEMEQLSKIGNAHAKVAMNLSKLDENQTELSFDGKAKLSGVIARTGQRVLSGVANSITNEVFASLRAYIKEHPEEGASVEKTPTEQNEETIENNEKRETNQQLTIWQRISAFFKNLFGN